MKNERIITTVIALIIYSNVSAQFLNPKDLTKALGEWAPTPVTNSVLEANAATTAKQTSLMAKVTVALEKMDKDYKSMLINPGFIKNLQTARRLMVLIESTVCTGKDLNVMMSQFENNCLFTVRFDVQIIQLSMAVDALSLVMAPASMTPGERITGLNNAIDKFERSQREMAELNMQLRRILYQWEMADRHAKGVNEMVNITRVVRR